MQHYPSIWRPEGPCLSASCETEQKEPNWSEERPVSILISLSTTSLFSRVIRYDHAGCSRVRELKAVIINSQKNAHSRILPRSLQAISYPLVVHQHRSTPSARKKTIKSPRRRIPRIVRATTLRYTHHNNPTPPSPLFRVHRTTESCCDPSRDSDSACAKASPLPTRLLRSRLALSPRSRPFRAYRRCR